MDKGGGSKALHQRVWPTPRVQKVRITSDPALTCEMAPHGSPCVLVIGSSYIRRLYAYICEHGLDRNLGLPCRITWDGRGGRRWEHLVSVLHSHRARPAPHILVINLGGNSLCTEGRNRFQFLQQMKEDMVKVRQMLPSTIVLFSDILPRWKWRGQTGKSGYGLERSRRWLNGAMSGFTSSCRHMGCIRHQNLGLSHLVEDGVHLTSEGNALFLGNIQGALQRWL